jgi:hypothetical protein
MDKTKLSNNDEAPAAFLRGTAYRFSFGCKIFTERKLQIIPNLSVVKINLEEQPVP